MSWVSWKSLFGGFAVQWIVVVHARWLELICPGSRQQATGFAHVLPWCANKSPDETDWLNNDDKDVGDDDDSDGDGAAIWRHLIALIVEGLHCDRIKRRRSSKQTTLSIITIIMNNINITVLPLQRTHTDYRTTMPKDPASTSSYRPPAHHIITSSQDILRLSLSLSLSLYVSLSLFLFHCVRTSSSFI